MCLWVIYIYPKIDLPILLQENMWIGQIAHRHMNLETGTEAAQFPERKYISAIFVAVWKAAPMIWIQSFFMIMVRSRIFPNNLHKLTFSQRVSNKLVTKAPLQIFLEERLITSADNSIFISNTTVFLSVIGKRPKQNGFWIPFMIRK